MGHPLYSYGPPVTVIGSGGTNSNTGEVEPGTPSSPHTPPANSGTVTEPGGSPSEELVGMYTPVLNSINPNTAVIGGANLTMTASGSKYLSSAQAPNFVSKIIFNGGVEPTTYISDTQVSTGVSPATAGTPGSYPVEVSNGGFKSASRPFSFTATGEEE
jgi:hypothetical protein